MSEPTAKYSFEIRTANDFLVKLHDEYTEFQANPLSSRHAINVAMTAWHLIDWVWEGHKPILLKINTTFSQRDNFVKYLVSQCPDLAIIQAICNGAKHFRIRDKSGAKTVKSTQTHHGAFSQVFSRGFDISLLEIELADDSICVFEDIVEKVVAFWDSFFTSHSIV